MANMRVEADESNFVAGLRKASGSVGALAGKINEDLVKSFKGADFYSKNFEKGIGRLGTAFKDAGMGMTIGLTLPLGLLAKSASDAYAEFDSLKKGLATLEPTTQGLTSRLAELREIAKAPGIGFQEAIQGDLRLRSVGIAAATSAKILKEFANAVALTGGGKEQLNEITVQLGQMSAKGKVLAQDLRPIIEAAPAVSQALKNMFGTVSSEAISEMLEKTGKSSTDMIEMLLAELSKAPRVTGGWKNALENLNTSLFIAKAEMFEVADNLFNLQGIIASVTSTVEGFVEGFKSLPEPTQKIILGLVTLTAVLGPLAIGIGLVSSALTSMVAVGGLTIGMVTGVVAVIGVLSIAFIEATARANELRKSKESVAEISAKASGSIDTEVKKVMSLIDIITDQKSGYKDIKSAKEALIKIDPSFKDSLKGEEVAYDNLEVALKRYIQKLKDAATVRTLQARVDENETKKQRLIADPTSGSVLTPLLPSSLRAAIQKKTIEENLQLIADYSKQNDSLIKEIAKIDIATAQKIESNKPTLTLGKGKKGDTNGVSDAEQALAEFLRVQEDSEDRINSAIKKKGEDRVALIDVVNRTTIAKREDGLNALLQYYTRLEGITTLTDKDRSEDKVYKDLGLSTPSEVKEAWDKRITAMMEGQAKEVEARKKAQEETWEGAVEFSNKINNQMTDMLAESGAEIVEGLLSGGDGLQNAFKNILNAFGNFAIQTGKSLLPMLKLLDTLKKKPGVGTAIGLIAGGAIVKGLASRISVPKLAEGGMATNPTLAMIGDNASGKEMVLPFEKTGQFANMIAQQMGGGGGNFSVATKISGNDLLILVERAKKTK